MKLNISGVGSIKRIPSASKILENSFNVNFSFLGVCKATTIFPSPSENKARLEFITIDEKTEKEKRSAVNYLVQAGTLKGAVSNIENVMGTTMIDYVIASVAETKLMDVFEYGKQEQKDEKPEFEG